MRFVSIVKNPSTLLISYYWFTCSFSGQTHECFDMELSLVNWDQTKKLRCSKKKNNKEASNHLQLYAIFLENYDN